jgi:hypothetical protein
MISQGREPPPAPRHGSELFGFLLNALEPEHLEQAMAAAEGTAGGFQALQHHTAANRERLTGL